MGRAARGGVVMQLDLVSAKTQNDSRIKHLEFQLCL